MPKSKRDKKISLTKTAKKGVALKQRIIEDIRSCVDEFDNIYVFSFNNIRNNTFKEIRNTWKPSRFFFGKNRVIGVGLGRTVEEEVQDGLHKVSECLKGERALLFTNKTEEEVIQYFESQNFEEFARSGNVAQRTVSLEEGPLENFSHAMEPYLRKLGLPTKLDKGIVTMIKPYEVCTEGSILTPEQAKILELLDIRMAAFEMKLKCSWNKNTGFKKYL